MGSVFRRIFAKENRETVARTLRPDQALRRGYLLLDDTLNYGTNTWAKAAEKHCSRKNLARISIVTGFAGSLVVEPNAPNGFRRMVSAVLFLAVIESFSVLNKFVKFDEKYSQLNPITQIQMVARGTALVLGSYATLMGVLLENATHLANAVYDFSLMFGFHFVSRGNGMLGRFINFIKPSEDNIRTGNGKPGTGN